MTPRETKSELARRLKINRVSLDRMLARPGAPSPTKAKRYQVADVARFIAAQDGGNLDNLRAARLREVQLRCMKLERELAIAAREVVSVAFVDAMFERLARSVRQKMFSALEELPARLAGLEAGPIRRQLRDVGDAICDKMQAEKTDLGPSYGTENKTP